MRYTDDLGKAYSPLYFLAALGAGGLAVSFFMYLMWMSPHQGQPIPSFDTLVAAFQTGNLAMQAMMAAALAGIAVFAFLHVRLLVWNVKQFNRWKHTDAYTALRNSNAESQLMAIPLAFAMSVNVGFIVGAVFVPGLWGIREILFPGAVLAFAVTGWYATKIFLRFFSRILTEGGYDCAKSNNLGQMVSVFAFSMVGVGFSAAAAMSHVKPVVATAFLLSTLFVVAAVVLGIIMLVLGFRSMMEYRVSGETTPTLWIVIPIITVLGIAMFRLKMSLAHNFGVETPAGEIFAFLATLMAIQLLFGAIGWAVMKRVGYYNEWIAGDKRSPGAYALICPGVALFVFANFLINAGLVQIEVMDKFATGYLVAYLPLIALQAVTVLAFFKLNSKLLAPLEPSTSAKPVPAE